MQVLNNMTSIGAIICAFILMYFNGITLGPGLFGGFNCCKYIKTSDHVIDFR